jgi:hypothetical protein
MPSLIDPAGYFQGDRFDLMSDEARLYWPSFWCASNTLGRLELSYHKIRAEAFARYKKPPTEDKVWSLIREYQAAFLLFVYQDGAHFWGQWNTSVKYLPDYQTAADKRSPSPPGPEFDEWKNRYLDSKKKTTSAKLFAVNVSPKIQRNFEVSPDVPIGIGIGIGVGIGIGEKPCAKTGAGELRTIPESVKDEVAEWFHHEFYPRYPRKKAPDRALEAARAKLKTPELRAQALFALQEQLPEFRARDPVKIPYPASWINAGSWKDEADPLFLPETQGDARFKRLSGL